ncbi:MULTISPECIES: TetR/AcrR family transcriptional regulator [Mycolicibacterium]|uniref:TetR family transcriptional regulator n=1 Tax=Mycolicibacterium aichiense TaxID=1799 RepID=A0AAD1HPI8_9MYCO|nr:MULTISPECIES: TetR/AcrR family transcriptional regulator [Mycolicibacterium]MCV7019930.1 helix-turn-helix transcriptional regulator [Mycolicibacterium aichiense]BBX07521.1 TetR family transcriptional regulator [Mycolicibacterium aichiense]STZ81335.1 transcriptional regulatory protein [Mycolicibacterium aichiense]
MLSSADWVEAGFSLLAEQGVKALTVGRLCERVGATKGSFYWHFTDLGAYRRALADTWAEVNDTDRAEFIGLAELPPRERLSRMMRTLLGQRHWMLERAMREWARTDADVAAAVSASDRRVRRAVRQAYLDDGFSTEEAHVRADATFAAGVGFLHLSVTAPGAKATAQQQRFLDIMLRH